MVPAFNEEGSLEQTIKEIKAGVRNVDNYEIIIIDDCSSDRTPQIADQLSKNDKRIRSFHNNPNKGLGYNYRKGLELAQYEYYMYIPGDNQFPRQSFALVLSKLGEADIVIPYVNNMHIRPPLRHLISFHFTFLINLLFNLRISYYNSQVIHRTTLLKLSQPKTNSFAYQAETLIKMIKGGASYIEIGYDMTERQAGNTSAFKLKNVLSVIWTILSLFWQLQILRKPPLSKQARQLINHEYNT